MIEALPAPLALFLSALISSTLLPGGSEVLLVWLVRSSEYSHLLLWFSATLGNVLGSLLTWGMGFWIATRFPLKALEKPGHQRARRWLERYGPLGLLLAWLPVVGDPLCLVAGWLRMNFPLSLLMITLGKSLRYAVVLSLAS